MEAAADVEIDVQLEKNKINELAYRYGLQFPPEDNAVSYSITNTIKNLETQLNTSSTKSQADEQEMARLASELKKANYAKKQMEIELQEERENRRILEEKSLTLISDIKLQQQKKMSDLMNEVKILKSNIKSGEDYTVELEGTITNLKAELVKFKCDEIQNTSVLQNVTAKKYRHSIDRMESKLSHNTTEMELRISEINNKNEEELCALQNALKRQENDFSQLIEEKTAEIATLQGRLEESRNSRAQTLEEMRQMRKKYNADIKQMEKQVDELIEKNSVLENSKSIQEITQVQVLEEELEMTRRDKERLSIKIETIELENSNKEEKIAEMDRIVRRLESSLKSLEEQKENLQQTTQEFLTHRQESDVQSGTIQTLQFELNKYQTLYDSNKETLIMTKEKFRHLEKKLDKAQQELRTAKLDCRIEQREKNELAVKFDKQSADFKDMTEKLTNAQSEKVRIEKSLTTFQNEIQELKSKAEEDLVEITEGKRLLQEKSEEFEKVKAEVWTLTTGNHKYKKEVEEFSQIRTTLEEKEALIKEKMRLVQEKDLKIGQMAANISMLKEACKVLEIQLDDFEQAFCSKNQEIEDILRAKSAIESKHQALQHELTKTKTELNECKSMKLFIQNKLTSVETLQQNEEANKTSEVKSLNARISELNEQTKQLKLQLYTATNNLEENESGRSNLARLMEDLRRENGVLRTDVTKFTQELVKLKKSNIQLTEALTAALDKGQIYKSKMETAFRDLHKSESERIHSELVLQTTVEQHTKLIEHLRVQNDQLSCKKKKGGITGWIFGRDKDEPSATPISTPLLASGQLNMTTTVPGQTPRRILKEQNDIAALTEEANKMKRQLEYLHKMTRAADEDDDADVEAETDISADTNDMTPDHDLITTAKENVSPRAARKEESVLLKQQQQQQCLTTTLTSISSSGTDEEYIPPSPERSSKIGLYRRTILRQKEGSKLYINCIENMLNDIYVIGCEEGLYSTRLLEPGSAEEPNDPVKINGVDAIYQIGFIIDLNVAIMIEGADRDLILVQLGLLSACTAAQACSKPKVQFQLIGDLDNCIEFRIKQTQDSITLAVTTEKTLNVLFWEKSSFVLKQTLNVKGITGLCITPNSILLGNWNEKIYELDLKDWRLEEFIDDSDTTLSYILTSNRDVPTFPLAILDVGRSSLRPGDNNYESEYLLCFPELGVFVDMYGRRSRSCNIIWDKVPVSIVYTHPYLYILYFESIQIIKLTYESYTTVRVGLTTNSVGVEKEIESESKYFKLNNPRLLAIGNNANILINCFDSLKKAEEVLEICWEK